MWTATVAARIALTLGCCFACSTQLKAGRIAAESVALADVARAVASAAEGDTVAIPGGTASWKDTLIIKKAITLQGAGEDATIIESSVPATVNGGQLIQVGTEPGKSYRITGLQIAAGTVEQPGYGAIAIYGFSRAVRIDHIKTVGPVSHVIRFYDDIRGVVDHCYFDTPSRQAIYIGHPRWAGAGDFGDKSWASPVNWGSDEFIFIEDCTFRNQLSQGALDGCYGGRFVFRHNDVTDAFVGFHGTESTQRARGMRACEIYSNKFRSNTGLAPGAIYVRSGTGLIYDNSFDGYSTSAKAVNYREFSSFTPWGKADGTSPWDGPGGYPALDQVGRGQGDLLAGDPPKPVGWPNQAAEPVYFWNNRASNSPWPNLYNESPNIKEGRDFFNGTAKPDYKPFVYPHPLVSGTPVVPAPVAPKNLRVITP